MIALMNCLLKTTKSHEMRTIQKMQEKGHHFNCIRHLYQWHYQDIWKDKSRPTLHKTTKARQALLSTHLTLGPPLRAPWLPTGASLVCFSFPHRLSEVWANALRITEVLVELCLRM